jgi:hypothetical protein
MNHASIQSNRQPAFLLLGTEEFQSEAGELQGEEKGSDA